jgi:hypothetical protein
MEPRWGDQTLFGSSRFIGSLERFDLFILADSDVNHPWVLVIWGPHFTEYNRYQVQTIHIDFGGYWVPSADSDFPNEQELMHIEHFAMLFAPELGLVSRISSGRDADGT